MGQPAVNFAFEAAQKKVSITDVLSDKLWRMQRISQSQNTQLAPNY